MSFHIRFRTFKHFWFYFILFYSIFRPYQTSGFYPTFLYQYGFPRHSFCLCSFLNVTSSYPVFPPKSFFFLFIDIAIFFFSCLVCNLKFRFRSTEKSRLLISFCLISPLSFLCLWTTWFTYRILCWLNWSFTQTPISEYKTQTRWFLSFASSVSTFVFKRTPIYVHM